MEITLNVGKKFPQINGETSDQFAKEILRLEDSDFEIIILDFEGTEYINSMAMGTIFATYQNLSESNRHLKLINVNDRIKKLFKIANLTSIIDMD